MLRRLSIFLAAGSLVLAIGAAPAFAGSAQSAYVTTEQDCVYPIDLQVNQLGDLSDAYVWLKRVTESQVDDLVWSLYQGGQQVGDGTFDFICTTADGKYTLAYPDFNSDEGQTGTFTVKVDWLVVGGTNYSGDSFSVEPPA